jgi:hypothetical protein
MSNTLQHILQCAIVHPDATAITIGKEKLTYSELVSKAFSYFSNGKA